MSTAIRRRILKSEARKILFSNFFSCICLSASFILFLCGITSILRFINIYLYKFLSQNTFDCVMAVVKFLISLFCFPIIKGYISCFQRVALGESRVFLHLFDAFFNKAELVKTWVSTYTVAIIVYTSLIIPQIFTFIIRKITDKFYFLREVKFVSLSIKFIFLVFCLFIFVALCTSFCVLLCENCNLRKIFNLMKRRKNELFLFVISFSYHFVLAYLIPCIYLLILIPYFFISLSLFINFVITEITAPHLAELHEI